MDKANLKRIRLLAPGAIFFVCLIPFLNLSGIKAFADKFPDGIFIIFLTFICLSIGVIYYIFNCRDLLWRRVVLSFHNNVRNRMIRPFGNDPSVREIINHITDKEIMRIFYYLLDNDESLKDKQNDVRLNGVILTTVIDCIVWVIPFCIAYIVGYLCFKSSILFVAFIISVLLMCFLFILKRKLAVRHLNYENEQIAVINQLYKDKVHWMLESLKGI